MDHALLTLLQRIALGDATSEEIAALKPDELDTLMIQFLSKQANTLVPLARMLVTALHRIEEEGNADAARQIVREFAARDEYAAFFRLAEARRMTIEAAEQSDDKFRYSLLRLCRNLPW